MNISKSIFEHFLWEPIRSLAQNFQKYLNFEKLNLFKIFETNSFFEQCLVSSKVTTFDGLIIIVFKIWNKSITWEGKISPEVRFEKFDDISWRYEDRNFLRRNNLKFFNFKTCFTVGPEEVQCEKIRTSTNTKK